MLCRDFGRCRTPGAKAWTNPYVFATLQMGRGLDLDSQHDENLLLPTRHAEFNLGHFG